MGQLSLRDAAQLCGRGKSTIQAAIKDGRLSASRNDKGGYEIDPAELHRVFPFSMDAGRVRDTGDGTEQDTDFIGPPARPGHPPAPVNAGQLDTTGQDRTAGKGAGVDATNALLLQMLDQERASKAEVKLAMQARLDDMAETVTDLRKRLDTAEAEKLRLLPAPDAGQQKTPTKRQGFFGRIFGGRD